MAEEKATVTGLVTDDILKQALASREVLNPLKAAVKKVLSEQIDEAVETALSSLTGQAVDTAKDDDGNTVKEIDTGASADIGVADAVELQPGDTAQAEAVKASGATETQASGEAAATENAAGATATTTAAQPAEVKTAAADQTQKQA